MPAPNDLALLCTNLRTPSRKRPPLAEVLPARPPPSGDPEELELDEELLRRVREL